MDFGGCQDNVNYQRNIVYVDTIDGYSVAAWIVCAASQPVRTSAVVKPATREQSALCATVSGVS